MFLHQGPIRVSFSEFPPKMIQLAILDKGLFPSPKLSNYPDIGCHPKKRRWKDVVCQETWFAHREVMINHRACGAGWCWVSGSSMAQTMAAFAWWMSHMQEGTVVKALIWGYNQQNIGDVTATQQYPTSGIILYHTKLEVVDYWSCPDSLTSMIHINDSHQWGHHGYIMGTSQFEVYLLQ